MKPCRECKQEVSEQAMACPRCGAPYPAREKFDGWGFEYKTEATLAGLPWLHISFKYSPSRRPVPARGVLRPHVGLSRGYLRSGSFLQ